MQVLRYKVHNVLRVEDLDWDLKGAHLALIGGRNGQGKSSALRALLMALCGKSGCDWPEMPLKEGESEGWVRVELSGSKELMEEERLTAELLFTRKRSGVVAESFRLLDSSGEEAPEPRTLLKRLYRSRAFDPLEFERMKPKQQRETLLEVLGLDLTKVQDERQAVFQTRTQVNREHKQLLARLEAAELLEGPDVEVDTHALSQQLLAAQKSNRDYESKKRALGRVISDMEDAKTRLEALQSEVKKVKSSIKELEGGVKAAESDLDQAEQVDESGIVDQIAAASKTNAIVAQRAKFMDLQTAEEELQLQSDSLTERLREIDDSSRETLAEAEWPLEGMSVDDDGVLLDGLPFEQSSQSQRIKASVHLGMMLHPELRLLVCEDGSALDQDTLHELETLAKENDFQILLEIVTRSPDDERLCAVVIDEGRVRELA